MSQPTRCPKINASNWTTAVRFPAVGLSSRNAPASVCSLRPSGNAPAALELKRHFTSVTMRNCLTTTHGGMGIQDAVRIWPEPLGQICVASTICTEIFSNGATIGTVNSRMHLTLAAPLTETTVSSAAADGSTQQRSPAVRRGTMNNPATASITAAAESRERFPHHRRTEFDALNSGDHDECRFRQIGNFLVIDYSGWAIIMDCSVEIAAEWTKACDSYTLCTGKCRYIPQCCCNSITRMNR